MKFSIVTVCRNEGVGLQETILSVREQTFTDFEHILIDGASDDPVTLKILEETKTGFDFFVSEKDSGIYNAQNKGLQKCRGEFVLFLNAGDRLAGPEVLLQVSTAMQQAKADVYYGDMWIENKDGSRTYGRMPEDIHIFHMLRSTLWHPVSWIRRSLFSEYGSYSEKYKIVSDYEFFVKLVMSRKVRFHRIPVAISVFNLEGIGSSAQFEDLHLKERRAVQRELVPWTLRAAHGMSQKFSWMKELPFFRKLAKRILGIS